MNIAFLIDLSPASVLFEQVGRELCIEGFKVFWVCESKIPIKKYKLSAPGERIIFTEYVSSKEVEVDGYSNSFMFSNYDRDNELGLLKSRENYEEQNSVKLLSFFDNLILSKKIDCIVYENVSNAFSYAAYIVSQKNKIPYMGVIGSRLPGRFEIWDNPYGISERIKERILSNNLSVTANAWADNYLSEAPAPPDYMKNNPAFYKKSYLRHYIKKSKQIGSFFELVSSDMIQESRKAFQSPNPVKDVIWRACRVSKRALKMRRLKYIFDHPKENEGYYLYPLHYHPESSTSVLSPHYVDELNQVINIAFSLPIGRKLYIKEHPNAFGFKSVKFYQAIKKIPNARLISHKENTQELISNSLGVITLTSTMGYEALLKGVPTFVFGRVFYQSHQNCITIKSYDELYEKLISNAAHRKSTEINKKFIAAYYEETHPGKMVLEKTDKSFFESAIAIKEGIMKSIKVEFQ